MQSAVTHGTYNPKDYKSGWGDVVKDVGKTAAGAVAGLPEAQRMDAKFAAEDHEGTLAQQAMEAVRDKLPADLKAKFKAQMPEWKGKGANMSDFGQRAVAWLNSVAGHPEGKAAIENVKVVFDRFQMQEQQKQEQIRLQTQGQQGQMPAVGAPKVNPGMTSDANNTLKQLG